MDLDNAFEQSEQLVVEVLQIIDLPLIDSPRVQISDVACSLSLEHWHAMRALLELGLLPSALVIHRAQFEALVRSVWLPYAAREEDLAKLTATLGVESEQAAKNMPTTDRMMKHLEEKAPEQAYAALSRFKENSWKALNSYAHAGLHPLRRHEDGYPVTLMHNVLRNANGLGVVSCMQAVVLCGAQPLQKQLLEIGARYADVMPSLLYSEALVPT